MHRSSVYLSFFFFIVQVVCFVVSPFESSSITLFFLLFVRSTLMNRQLIPFFFCSFFSSCAVYQLFHCSSPEFFVSIYESRRNTRLFFFIFTFDSSTFTRYSFFYSYFLHYAESNRFSIVQVVYFTCIPLKHPIKLIFFYFFLPLNHPLVFPLTTFHFAQFISTFPYCKSRELSVYLFIIL